MKHLVSTLAVALALTSALPAMAMSSPQPTAMPAYSAAPHRVGEIPLVLSVTTYRAVAYGERASKIIGATVYNQQGQAVGKVADLVINPHDSVSIVIVSVGGFLGLGAKDVAISAHDFRFEGRRVVLPRATKQVLEQLPAFHFAH